VREVIHDPRDGEVLCSRCQKRLNRTDRLCWSCGSEKLTIVGAELLSLQALRDEPINQELISTHEDFMRRMVQAKWPTPPLGGLIPGATTGPRPGYNLGPPYAGQMKLHTCQHGLTRCLTCQRMKCADLGLCEPCYQQDKNPHYKASCPAGNPDNVLQP
jgi:hypothetical protein